MTYTHRNGETEPPEIYERDYWFLCGNKADPDDGPEDGLVYLSVEDENAIYDHLGHKYSLVGLAGRWWGPVTPPWDAELNQKPITEEDGRRWAKQFCQMFVEVHVPRLAREIAEELAEFDKEQRGSRPRSKA